MFGIIGACLIVIAAVTALLTVKIGEYQEEACPGGPNIW